MTIVISGADEAKFISKMDKALDRFYDKYAEQYPKSLTLMKKSSLKTRTCYGGCREYRQPCSTTAFNGTYYKDDDGNVIALTNIGSISTKNQRLRVQVSARLAARRSIWMK